jgi:hypothetical protein
MKYLRGQRQSGDVQVFSEVECSQCIATNALPFALKEMVDICIMKTTCASG